MNKIIKLAVLAACFSLGLSLSARGEDKAAGSGKAAKSGKTAKGGAGLLQLTAMDPKSHDLTFRYRMVETAAAQ